MSNSSNNKSVLSPKRLSSNTENNILGGNKAQSYSIDDLYKIIQIQQSTINKLTQEVFIFT
jgi:hypothetical protein